MSTISITTKYRMRKLVSNLFINFPNLVFFYISNREAIKIENFLKSGSPVEDRTRWPLLMAFFLFRGWGDMFKGGVANTESGLALRW